MSHFLAILHSCDILLTLFYMQHSYPKNPRHFVKIFYYRTLSYYFLEINSSTSLRREFYGAFPSNTYLGMLMFEMSIRGCACCWDDSQYYALQEVIPWLFNIVLPNWINGEIKFYCLEMPSEMKAFYIYLPKWRRRLVFITKRPFPNSFDFG